MLNLGTIVRALFTTLKVESGRTIFVEGAATGTGMEALKSAARNGLAAVGLVSSDERAAYVKTLGAAGAINRKDPRWADRVHARCRPTPEAIAAWEAAGEPLCEAMRAQTGGRLADYVVSHAGQESFPRSFQLLADGGTLTFYGATSGYWFSFVGKRGAESPETMLRRASLRAGEAVLLYYGVGDPALLDARRPRGDRGGACGRRAAAWSRPPPMRSASSCSRSASATRCAAWCRSRRSAARKAPTSTGPRPCRRCRMRSARPRSSRRPCGSTRNAR